MPRMSPPLPLGKAPAKYDPRTLQMTRYTKDIDLPLLPTTDLGNYDLFPADGWGMLGNDEYGDCVEADAGHGTMLWNAEAGTPVTVTDKDALALYTAITGFNPKKPNTDQGTVMLDALNYRRKTGMHLATDGSVHKIGAYVSITPGDVTNLKMAIYLFGAASIGVEFPDSAMNQFNAGEPWTVVKGAHIEGGHDVIVVGYLVAEDMFLVVTWGQLQKVAPSWIKKYMDEGYGVLSYDMLKNGLSVNGFDAEQLNDDVEQLGGQPDPNPPAPPTPTPPPDPDPPAPPDPTPPAEGATIYVADALAAINALPHVTN
jgi:hypothetical protein